MDEFRMSNCPSRSCIVAILLTLVCLAGCSGKPKPPPSSGVNPQAAGAKAIADFDANKDGKLNAEELKKCPGLQDAVKRVDKDGDNAVPACAEACNSEGHEAFVFGDLNNPDSRISQELAKHGGTQIRADLGLNVGIRYRGI